MTVDNGNGHRFTGAGFGTLTLHRWREQVTTGPPPRVVSERAVLRDGLPAIYRDSDFAMRFVGALETVLDPITATLDGVHHLVDPQTAPPAVLDLLGAWLGLEPDEDQPLEARRALVRGAAEISRRRGTARGLEMALALTFPELPLRVEDEGNVTWPGGPQPGGARFVVYCDEPIDQDRQAAVARCIEREKPVHVRYRLRVKAPKQASS